MRLFRRSERSSVAPPPGPDEGPSPAAVSLTLGREAGNGAPLRWALLDRVGLPGTLAILAPYDQRRRFFERTLPELCTSGPTLLVDPLEMTHSDAPLTTHRIGDGRGVSLEAPAHGETLDVARSAQAIAWWYASGAEWSSAVEAILERTIEALARRGESPSAERLAHLLREAAARAQEPELRGGCVRISEGLFSLVGSDVARALFSDPVGTTPTDRLLALSIAPETRGDPAAVRLAAVGLLRLVARCIPARDGGSIVFPALGDLGGVDLVERLAADLLWPLRNRGIGAVIGSERLTPWESSAGLPSALLSRSDAWLVSLGEEQRIGWESVLGDWAAPATMATAFDAIVAAGGDAALIAPTIRREPIGLRAFD
jgi:hypothetical protein